MTAFTLGESAAGWPALPPIGRPLANQRTLVLDRLSAVPGEPVPQGISGELYLGGAGLARGYLGRPELTAERFLPDPWSGEPGARLYRTGDLARFRPTGVLDYLGRTDQQVKVRGFRIEPGDIEAVLSGYPGVRSAAVLARQSPGGTGSRLVAYVAAGEVKGEELRAYLAARLPDYMVPSAFVFLERLPLTPSGKVDRRSLARIEPAAARAVAGGEPRTEVEILLAAIWAEVLGVEKVSIEDNFFDLGGHSLLATRVLARVRQAFAVEIALKRLFETSSLGGLATAVEEALAAGPGGRSQEWSAPIVALARPGVELPLSFAQERLWFLDQLEPGSAAYNLGSALRLTGELDGPALEASLGEIVRRHAVLRTRFRSVDGRPMQVISPPSASLLPRVDLSALPAGERLPELSRFAAAEARRPFDLAFGPLFRTTLVRLGDGEHAVLFSQHHIVSDGWSVGVLVRELGALYADFHARRPPSLPEPRLQYADFAVWQREWLGSGELEAQLEYWRARLAGVPALLDLPLDRPRNAAGAAGSTGRSGRLKRRLPDGLSRSVRQLGRRDPGRVSTLFMVLLAGWSAFLSRISGQEEVVVGTPIANRTRREVEGLIGFFVNTLALRVHLKSDPEVTAIVDRVRRTTLADFAHQDLPFELLVGEMAAERHLGHSPFFQVLLILQNASEETLELPGLTLEALPAATEEAKFDLSLAVTETPTGLSLSLEYRRDLLDATTVARLAAAFETLLAGAAARPETRLSELPLLGAVERQQLTLEWSGERPDYPRDRSIPELFVEQAALAPDTVAVVLAAEHLSYGALAGRAALLARSLGAYGLAAGSRIGLCLDRSLARVVATLAILEAGCAYLPLDPSYPRKRLDFLVRDSAAPLILTEERWRSVLPESGVDVLCLDRSEEPAQPASVRAPSVGAGDPAYVMYTSGSTGTPKGVTVPHRAVARLVLGADYAAFGPEEVFLQLAPYAFDAATLEVWGAFLHGGRLVIPPPGELSLEEIGALLVRHGITTLWLTAGLFHQMVDLNLPALSGLRQLLAGGDVLSPAHVTRVLTGLPGTRLINGYGPTENTTFTCCFPVEPGTDLTRPLPVGRPIANTRVYLLDRQLTPLPMGVAGELTVGGDGLAWGYLDRPELTAECFVPSPFGVEEGGERGARLYRTGDLARFSGAGQIEFLGRIDTQVKIRGFRIEPGEIEAVLLSHPAVEAATVVVRRDAGDDPRLFAYVVAPVGKDPASGPVLRAFLGKRLPAHMVPAGFVPLAALPLTPNGKVDRRALSELDVQAVAGSEAAYAAPRTPVEEIVAGIWGELLAVELVGGDDNFFVLGGHSLLATRVISRVRQAFGIELPLRSLFEAATVATFARHVESSLAALTVPGRQASPLIAVVRHDRDLPLSFAQERLWLIDRLQPGSAAYNIPAALRLCGELDLKALEATFAELDRRHESLRTTFREVGGQLVQVVHPTGLQALRRIDLSGLVAERREGEARRLARDDARRPFDLVAGPLLRLTLLQLRVQPGEHQLLLTQHHIISDGWSMGILVRELGALYPAFHEGRPSPLPEPALQYADFAVWQREGLAGGELEIQLGYWRSRLAGAPELLELPLDRPRRPLPGSRSGRVPQRLPESLLRRLRALGRGTAGLEATLFMVLLAAWSALLARLSGQEDVVIGSPIANRTHGETENLIGFFVNTLALRTDLSGDPELTSLLGRVRQATLADYAHQDLPFERLVGELVAERSLTHSPIVQTFLALQNTPAERLELPGLTLEMLSVDSEAVKFDLSLEWKETPDGLSGGWIYRASLFDAVTVARFAGHFETLLGGLLERPAARLSELPLLTMAERLQMVEWSRGEVTAVSEVCLHELVLAQARRTPEAAAVVFETAVLSYGELASRALRLAGRLCSLGVGPEVSVGICLERSLELVVGLTAILKAGGAYVPLDPSYPRERLARMLEDTLPPVVLVDEGTAPLLPAHPGCQVAVGGGGGLMETAAIPGRRADADAGAGVEPENLAYVIFTSGSTGRPKGAMNSHRAIVNRLLWAQVHHGLTAADRVLQKTPVSFDVSVWELFLPLLSGACLVMARPGGHQDPAYLARTLAREGVTVTHFVPAMMQAFLAEPEVERATALRLVVASGEALPLALQERFFSRLKAVGLLNLYGPTEAAVDVTFWQCQPGTSAVPIGRPVANTTIRLFDPDRRPVPVGVAGELYIGGVQVARGYLGRPDLTAERFVPDPEGEAGSRLYRTGDLARRLAAGEIEYLGRLDHQVKVRGFRIELGEIEAALAGEPGVREAVVLVREDEPGDRSLVAYVAGAVQGAAGAAALRVALQGKLPKPMVPSLIVTLSALPLTVNGKVDRRALARIEPERPREGEERPPAARSATEELLTEIWSQLLGCDAGAVGVDDSFFDLGGHSLLATRVVARVRQVFGVDLPLRELFDAPTLCGFAVRIEGARGACRPSAPPLVALLWSGEPPLSFSQQRLWFIDQLTPGRAQYNVPIALRIEGPLRPAILAWSLGEIERRHEVLRTSLPALDGSPVQRIHPPRPFELPRIDLLGLPAPQREDVAAELAEAAARRPFDLARGPLWRAVLVGLAAEENHLLLAQHHVVSDGWSMGVLVRELTVLYPSAVAGEPSPLPELAIQYADFAVWQRSWMGGEVLAGAIAAWRRQLAGAAVLELPTDRPRPAIAASRGAVRPVRLAPEIAAGLRGLGRNGEATLFMTGLAVFQLLLARWSGQDDISVGTPVAGRTRRELEELIGFFVNTLVLRTHLSGAPSIRQLLHRVREVALAAYAHQDLPFEKLVAELQPDRSLGRSPLFQVMLALQNAPRERLALADLTFRFLPIERGAAQFDLTLTLTELEDGALAGTLEYDSDLFDATTVERLMGHFAALARAAAGDPDAGIAELAALEEAERHQLLHEWSGAVPRGTETAEFPCLQELFREQARCRPEAVAVIAEGRRLLYGELDAWSDRLASRLVRLGLAPGEPVGLFLDRSPEMVVAILATLKAGGAYLPLDTSYPRERLTFILTDASPTLVLTTAALAAGLPDTGALVVDLDEADFGPETSAGPLAVPLSSAHPAYIIYTSGSTGRPKGVVVGHANAARLFSETRGWFDFDERDVWTLFHSYAFDFSVWELWGALAHGGRLVIVPYLVSRSPEAFHALLRRERVTVLNQTPTAFRQLVRWEEEVLPPAAEALPDLRLVVFGGEALDVAHLASWWARHGEDRPRLVNMYGITETTVHVTYRPVSREDLDRASSPIGRTIPDLSVLLLDAAAYPVPIGVTGEIHVAGAGLAQGYLNRPELTAERFVPHPFAVWPGERLYRSGDLARFRPAGGIEYLGRADLQVKIRGFRIELGEIEAALAEHPGVRDAVVLARPDAAGELRLIAWFVVASEPGQAGGTGETEEPSAADLRRFLAARLPEPMLPTAFVPIPGLPLTAHGKLDRQSLPDPAAVASRAAGEPASPETPAERILAAVVEEVLGVPRADLLDSFFGLGGDSIKAIRLRALAERRGLSLPLEEVFRQGSLRELARAAEPPSAAAAPEPEIAPFSQIAAADRVRLPADVEDAYPLSFLQAGMIFHNELSGAAGLYLNVLSLHLETDLDVAALRWALEQLAARHSVLRTSFDLERFGEALQLVHRRAEIPLGILDLTALPAGRQQEALAACFKGAGRRFDLGRSPLLRFAVCRLGPGSWQLLMAEHHAILDGWSVATLLSELFNLYLFRRREAPPPGAPPASVFRDFVVRERQTLERRESRDFWQEALRDRPSIVFPHWSLSRAAQTIEGDSRRPSVQVPIDAHLSAALARLARASALPEKSLLLAAHLKVLSVSYGPDVVTGLVANGRPEVDDGDRALGLFLNTLPFRLCLAPGSWLDLARQTLDAERQLMPHRRFPLAELQRSLGDGGPLFEVAFNFVHFHALDGVARLGGFAVEGQGAVADNNFPLAVGFNVSLDSHLALSIAYDPGRFPTAFVQTLAGRFARVLADLAERPDGPHSTAPLLAVAEEQQLLLEWNDSAADLGPELRLHDLFTAQANRRPAAVALLADAAFLSYGELARQAAALADRLRSLGVKPEVRVGLHLERSFDLVIALLAVLEAGGAYVPLDPAFPRQRLAFQLADSGVRLLFTRGEEGAALAPEGVRMLFLDGAAGTVGPVPISAGGESGDRAGVGGDLDDLAYVIYTSGSTGRPNGVLLAHRGAVNLIRGASALLCAGCESRVLQVASPGFDASVLETFVALANGGSLCLVREEERRSPDLLAARIVRDGVNLVAATPSQLSLLPEPALAGLRTLIIGGEAFPEDLARRWAPGRRLLNAYGPTEATIFATAAVLGEGRAPAIGRPVANLAAYVLDAASGPLPIGAVGELVLAGPGLARGYLGRPGLTAERFVPDPFSPTPGARLYRTGDLARRRPDGALEFLGRRDDQVKVRGVRIELGEIEAALESHPAIGAAAALARADGPGERRLVAYLVPRPGGEVPEAEELRSFLAERLPEAMLPMVMVELAALPLTPSGKLDRRALPAPAVERRLARELVAPRDPVEIELARIWEEVLAVRPVGVHDGFFDLGGHSMAAVRLMARIRASFGQDLPISLLFERPTVEELAVLLRERTEPRTGSDRTLVEIQPAGEGSPFFCVHPVGGDVLCYAALARKMGTDRPFHGLRSTAADGQAETRLEDLANRYLGEVRAVQPVGPYLLGGWSLGGLVAFEMARQLRRSGEEVGIVALIDPPAPTAARRPPVGEAGLAYRFAKDLAALNGQALPDIAELPERVVANGRGALLRQLFNQLSAARLLPSEIGFEELRQRFLTFARNFRAAESYAPGLCDAPLALFLAEGSPGVVERAAAWTPLAAAGLEIHLLPGDHYSLLERERVEPLAARLRSLLAAADRLGEPSASTTS